MLNDMTRNYYGQRPCGVNMTCREKAPSPMHEFHVSALPANPVVAMAYVPMQTDTTVFDEAKALSEGTLFPCLCKPFRGAGDRR